MFQFLLVLLSFGDISQPPPFPRFQSVYMNVMDSAAKRNRVAVVFVGHNDTAIGRNFGAVVVSGVAEKIEGYPARCVVVCKPDGAGWMNHARTLPEGATDAQIREAVTGEQVSLPATPFGVRAALQIADASRWLSREEQQRLRKLWPSKVAFPEGFRFYEPTQYSQYLAVSDNVEVIIPFHRDQDQAFSNDRPALNPNRHVAEWTAPGGLVGVPRSEWRSFTGVSFPAGSVVASFQGRVAVPTAPRGSLPKEQWEWPDGTIFGDMLVNAQGEVFELRMREKISADQWDSLTPYKNKLARPDGYTGAGKKCAECHDKPSPDGDQYFINLRKQDTAFSLSPLREGTVELDYANFPIERRTARR